MHTSIGIKFIGKTVTAFSLAGSLEDQTMVSIDKEHAFSGDGDKIRLPKTEVLLRTAADELSK